MLQVKDKTACIFTSNAIAILSKMNHPAKFDARRANRKTLLISPRLHRRNAARSISSNKSECSQKPEPQTHGQTLPQKQKPAGFTSLRVFHSRKHDYACSV
ncbi:MAG: hypothetical protein LBR88_00635 [Zoogloeaceae bacterium]|jgi:hypothetical protein|nr:hypothetical protein [Zoogloeaceae bacterium]